MFSDEDDAPESIPLLDSKKAAAQRSSELKNYEAERKKRRRDENREKDRVLKEQASRRKGKEKEVEVEGSDDSDDSDDQEDSEENSERDHLPEHLFAAAFAPANVKSKPPIQPKKRKRATHKPKDLVIGSRVIRTLTSKSEPVSAAPSRRIKKFLDRNLGLKGHRRQGWERRPVNVGVMKTSGPAANFVRSRY